MEPTENYINIFVDGKMVFFGLSVPDGPGGVGRVLRMLFYTEGIEKPDYEVCRRWHPIESRRMIPLVLA